MIKWSRVWGMWWKVGKRAEWFWEMVWIIWIIAEHTSSCKALVSSDKWFADVHTQLGSLARCLERWAGQRTERASEKKTEKHRQICIPEAIKDRKLKKKRDIKAECKRKGRLLGSHARHWSWTKGSRPFTYPCCLVHDILWQTHVLLCISDGVLQVTKCTWEPQDEILLRFYSKVRITFESPVPCQNPYLALSESLSQYMPPRNPGGK